MRDGRIVEVMVVVGVEGSRVLFERFLPLHDTVLKRYRVAGYCRMRSAGGRFAAWVLRSAESRICLMKHIALFDWSSNQIGTPS